MGAAPIQGFFRQMRPGAREVLFLDYDGTLAPFGVDRDRAVPYPRVREALEKIQRETQTRVVFVSGRRAEEVQTLLGIRGVEVWGCHGFERLHRDGTLESVSVPQPVADALQAARDAVYDLDEPSRLERKPSSVAFHLRGLPDAQAVQLEATVESRWLAICDAVDGLDLHSFDGGVELRIADVNKGDAIRAVLEGWPPDAPLAYLGDDVTDEDAFEALDGSGALRILVRNEPRPTWADASLRAPEGLLEFLHQWCRTFTSNKTIQRTRPNMTDNTGVNIVSNRLPIVLHRDEADDRWEIDTGSGGLVQAMNPILERNGGRWIGWPGVVVEELGDAALPLNELDVPYTLHPVIMSSDEVDNYYRGFANSIVWPLFHNFPDRCSFDPEFWEAYLVVNEKFANEIAAVVERGSVLWVHDYHLIHLAEMLRSRMEVGRLGFFLHIPFPSLENLVKLPWRADVLRALLSYELVGFQTTRDRRHFLECVERLMPDVRVTSTGDGLAHIDLPDRTVCVGAFPIGIDAESWSTRAASPAVDQRVRLLRREIGPYQVLLGIDRLDYTKGLLERFRAFERALERQPALVENAMLFQLVIPSREQVPEYAALKREIDRTVGRINGRFSTPSWQPIRYLYNTVDPIELTALYRIADVAVVTPLCDGMNLVCKEYVASKVDESGVLILGEMAGAASQLAEWALLVNPYDIDGTADAIITAVTMPDEDREERMRALRKVVTDTDVFRWADHFLLALRDPGALDQSSEPEYLPHIEAPGHR